MMTTVPVETRGRPVATAIGRPRRVHALLIGLLLVLAACVPAEPPAPGPAVPAPEMEGPALEAAPGTPDDARVEEATRLLEEGERALARGDAGTALARAEEIESGFAEVPGTSRALWLRGRAHEARGEWEDAGRALARFLELVPAEDPLRPAAAVLLARSRVEPGERDAVEALFRVPEDAGPELRAEAEELAVRSAAGLTLGELRQLAAEAPSHEFVLAPFLTELAVRRALMGELGEGRALAERALDLEPGDRVAERARQVADGRMEDLTGEAFLLGALVSEGGPPSLRQLSGDIRAGIEVAVVEASEAGLPVRLEVLDDEADGARATELVRRLEGEGAAGLVGPLVDPVVAAAAEARAGALPLVSPTARVLPAGSSGVLSLTGVDPAAVGTLARAAAAAGIRDVVVLHPTLPDFAEEAELFRDGFEAEGGVVRRVLTYPAGTTSFAGPFETVVSLAPDALVLLVPPEEVGLVAPQVAYYGVDELEIQILGNEAWSSESVLEEVPARHTEGVLTVTSRGDAGEFGPRWDAFVELYESHFERTLRSPASALGYDAARLLLQAASQGDGTPEGTARALDTIREFPGATGMLDVIDGRIQRSYEAVRIENREAVRPARP